MIMVIIKIPENEIIYIVSRTLLLKVSNHILIALSFLSSMFLVRYIHILAAPNFVSCCNSIELNCVTCFGVYLIYKSLFHETQDIALDTYEPLCLMHDVFSNPVLESSRFIY